MLHKVDDNDDVTLCGADLGVPAPAPEIPGLETIRLDLLPDPLSSSGSFLFTCCSTLSDLHPAGPDRLPGPVVPGPAPRYRIGAVIGRGGMAVVHEALDTQLNRKVAIKVIQDKLKGKPRAVGRFIQEAQITGRLQHPGIVSVHDYGYLPDGRCFFVMDLVAGRSLKQILKDREDPSASFGQVLLIFDKVCDAVAYAHSIGVIHRDLKPENIIVGAFGVVKVMDWGLGKFIGDPDRDESPEVNQAPGSPPDPDADLDPLSNSETVFRTLFGAVLGTPAYCAPEQARGDTAKIDQRVDVFGLGSMLCEILTGQPSYHGDRFSEIYAKAVDAALGEAMQRLDQCGAPAELIELARRCLSPEAEDRPPSGVEVSGAIDAYLQSEQRRAERDFVRFFDLSLDLFCIANLRGYFLRVNENFSRVLGYSAGQLTSRPFLDFVHPEDRGVTEAEVVRLSGGEPCIRLLNRYRHADGHYLWFEWNAKSVPEERAIYAVAREVTGRPRVPPGSPLDGLDEIPPGG